MEFIVISLKIMALFKQSTDQNFFLKINELELQLTINDIWKLLLELVIAMINRSYLFCLTVPNLTYFFTRLRKDFYTAQLF